MPPIIGIRREDKNKWERRVPLTPAHLADLRQNADLQSLIQPSAIRVFPDSDYQAAGAVVTEDLSAAAVVIGVKEMPPDFFLPGRTYVFFSHTVKGQAYNMPMLRRLAAQGCNLIDYERIVDDAGRRLIFFGRFAGLAGMVETLLAIGRKLAQRGLSTPLDQLKPAWQYPSVSTARQAVAEIGRAIGQSGWPAGMAPLVVGFTGYGNVSQGAQEIFDALPHHLLRPADLPHATGHVREPFAKVVFGEADLVEPLHGEFQLEEYYRHPDRYRGVFDRYLPHLDILVNGIYWDERYPRLLTRAGLRQQAEASPRLMVVGDISCDIDGSVEITHRVTCPDHPCFTYHPITDSFEDGVAATGVTVMAVDNLPCEFPADASQEFSDALRPFLPEIARADFSLPYDKLRLSPPIRRALILHQGRLTPDYTHLQRFLSEA